jgi:hypothetical protein
MNNQTMGRKLDQITPFRYETQDSQSRGNPTTKDEGDEEAGEQGEGSRGNWRKIFSLAPCTLPLCFFPMPNAPCPYLRFVQSTILMCENVISLRIKLGNQVIIRVISLIISSSITNFQIHYRLMGMIH